MEYGSWWLQQQLRNKEPPTWCPEFTPGQKITMRELSNDVLMEILDHCAINDMRHMSMVSKLFRALCIPKLFQAVSIGNRDTHPHKAIMSLMVSKDLLPAIRSVSFGSIYHRPEKDAPSAEDVAAAMFQLLAAVPKLIEVKWSIVPDIDRVIPALEKLVAKDATFVQRVRSLGIPPHAPVSHVLSGHFPNLVTLDMPVAKSALRTPGLQALRSLKSLRALALDHEYSEGGWRPRDIQCLLDLIPDIECLVLRGELKNTRVSNLIDTFADFPKLKRLALPSHQVVQPHPRFQDDRLLDEIEFLKENHPLNEDEETNGELFFSLCPELECIIFYVSSITQQMYVPGFDEDEDMIIAVSVEDLYSSFENFKASPDYWDGELPAVF